VIVNQDGHGLWDPLSEAKGDVFSLVQHLDPSFDFRPARRVLRGLAGVTPTFAAALRIRRSRASLFPVARRWERHPILSRGSRTWLYLTGVRRLPDYTLLAAASRKGRTMSRGGGCWAARCRRRAAVTRHLCSLPWLTRIWSGCWPRWRLGRYVGGTDRLCEAHHAAVLAYGEAPTWGLSCLWGTAQRDNPLSGTRSGDHTEAPGEPQAPHAAPWTLILGSFPAA
jgi:hypothetical protein